MEIRKPTIGGLQRKRVLPTIHGMIDAGFQYEKIGKRLQGVRSGFSDLTQKAWAERHGFNPTQYNNWEKGFRRIPVDAAEHLCETYGLTLDFIYRGRRDGLSDTALKSL